VDFEVFVNGAPIAPADYLAAGGALSAAGVYYFDTTSNKVYFDDDGDGNADADNVADFDINGNGVKIELFDTDDPGDGKADAIFYTIYQVGILAKDPVVKTNATDGKDYIFIDFTGASPAADIGEAACTSTLASSVKGYDGLVKGDVVAAGRYEQRLRPHQDGEDDRPGHRPERHQPDHRRHGLQGAKSADASITAYAEGFYTDVDFYCDEYGFLAYAKAIAQTSTDYLYILENGRTPTT
jgi:hypothetical protein